MRDVLLVLAGAVGITLVEMVAIFVLAIKKLLKERSGQDSREPIKESVVPILGKE